MHVKYPSETDVHLDFLYQNLIKTSKLQYIAALLHISLFPITLYIILKLTKEKNPPPNDFMFIFILNLQRYIIYTQHIIFAINTPSSFFTSDFALHIRLSPNYTSPSLLPTTPMFNSITLCHLRIGSCPSLNQNGKLIQKH